MGALSAKVWRGLAVLNFTALLLAGCALRGWQLETIPGLNGDEAWLGVQAAHLAAGEPIAWRTPTGNPVNPLMLLPLAALHAIFSPSVALVRSVAVVSGLALLAVNFWLCRKVLDRKTALVSTALLAVMPTLIAYSRFAWDSSQTPLVIVLVLYFSLATLERSALPARRWPAPDWLPALLAFGVAVWIHPTNIFTLWLLLVPAVYRYAGQWRATIQKAWLLRPSLVWTVGSAVALIAALAGWYERHLLLTAAVRAIDPEQAGLFVRRLVRLVSGGTILEFIPGPPRTTDGLDRFDFALVLLIAVAAAGLAGRWKRRDAVRERSLTWATGLMLLTFYLVAGPAAISPHFERYGICLIVPIAVLLASGWSYWLGQGPVSFKAGQQAVRDTRQRARFAVMVLSAVAWLWLINFYRDYFLVFQTSGGTSHVAFRTAEVEPKQAALDAILAAEGQSNLGLSDKPIWIVADSWWSHWPLAYFAVGPTERARRRPGRLAERAGESLANRQCLAGEVSSQRSRQRRVDAGGNERRLARCDHDLRCERYATARRPAHRAMTPKGDWLRSPR